MKINKLINTDYKTRIKSIKTNSQAIKKGDIFVCALGNIDKTKYIQEAINNKTSFIISNKPFYYDIPHYITNNPNKLLKEILDKYYHYPLTKINLVGITGTDGKTKTTTILKDMTNSSCLGTNGFIINNHVYSLNNTTPSLDIIYNCLNKSIKKKKKDVFMEVSSEAYLTKRIPYLHFNIGVFTNITKEHLDKHKTFKNYFNCKMQLLKNSSLVIINHDSKYFNKIKRVNTHYQTYGFKKSDITIKKYQLFMDHTVISFIYKNNIYQIDSPLIGIYNIYNLMAAILVLLNLNYPMPVILKSIKNIKPIIGRNEIIYQKEFTIMLDHAHTINATLNILKFINKFKKGRIITIVGCAGSRYQKKRKIIGKIVNKYSDICLYTSDDPREEKVSKIIKEMLSFYKKKKEYYIIEKREEAIEKALSIVQKDDIILVLGRGRDNIMHVQNKDIIYSDYDTIISKLKALNYLHKC